MEKIISTDNTACGGSDISGVKNKTDKISPEKSDAEYRYAADNGKNDGACFVKDNSVGSGSEGMTKPNENDLPHGVEESIFSSAEQTDCESTACTLSEAEKEDREFLSLIKGKYRDAYRRRTEAIIRRRLKSTKGKTSDNSLAADVQAVETDKNVISRSVSETLNESFDKPMSVEAVASAPENVSVASDKEAIALNTAEIENSEETVSSEKRRRYAAQKSQNLLRPRENGVGGSVGMYTGINVSALKGSDVLALLRRAEAGEKIKFN